MEQQTKNDVIEQLFIRDKINNSTMMNYRNIYSQRPSSR